MSGSQFGAGGGMPQLPPQVLQALMQMMAQRQGAQGGGPMPQGPMPAMPQGAMPQGMPPGPMAPPQAAGGMAQGAGGGMQPPPAGSPYGPPMAPPGGGAGPMAPGQQAPVAGQMPMTVPQLAMKGRFGDTNVAHVAPGEIQVPPEIQTPQLLSILRAAFQQAGVSPNQFTAGSPVASRNPQTGAQEFSILGALLPVAGAALGSFVPGIGTAAGMAAGGALGGAAGGLVDHQSPLGVALSAAGGGAGGYLGGSGGLSALAGGAGAAGTAGAGAAGTAGAAGGAAGTAGNGVFTGLGNSGYDTALAYQAAGQGAANPAASVASSPSILSALKGATYAGMGAGLGGSLAPNTTSPLPPGFNNPLPPTNPNFNQLLGNQQSSTPTFTGYNPYTAVTGPNPGYRFYQ